MIGKTNAISGVSEPVPKIRTVSGSVISISNALALPAVSFVADIDAVQSGSGDPSPDNVRPISGHTAVTVNHAGASQSDNPQSVTVQLGQTVYGGTLDVVSGELVVTHISDTKKLSAYSVVSTGTNTVHYRLFNSAFSTLLPKNQGSGNFSNVAKNVYNSSDTTHFYPNTSNGRIELWLPIGTDTNTDVQIVCELATPQTVQLSETTIQMLLGNNTLWADSGDSELQYWARR